MMSEVDKLMQQAFTIIKKKQLWINPFFSDEQIRETYNSKLDLSTKLGFINGIKDIMRSRFGPEKDFSIMDAGCGFGSFVIACQKQGIDAWGVDISVSEIEFAKERAKQEKTSHDKFVALDAQNTIETLQHRFDVVVSDQVVEHVDDYRRYIDACLEYLTDDGVFIIMAPNYLWRWREPHYCIWWMPCMPKNLARFIVQARHLGLEYFDTQLRLVNKYMIQSYLKKKGYDVAPYGFFKLDTLQINSPVKRTIAQIAKVTGTQKVLYQFMKWFPFTSSISYVAYKQA